jgi:hypothetical protein
LACGFTGDLWDADANAISIQQLLGALLSLMGGLVFCLQYYRFLTAPQNGTEELDLCMALLEVEEDTQQP